MYSINKDFNPAFFFKMVPIVSAALERCLGPQAEEASILAAETGKKTLTEAVAVLSAKTALLEPKNLDLFEGEKTANFFQ
jgi:hypothetical protein